MTEISGDANVLLEIEAVADATDQRILRSAWSFLQSPEAKALADITVHMTEVGSVSQGYEMTGGTAPGVVSTLYDRLVLLHRQRHIADARAELEQPAPDLLKLLYCVRMASDNAASVPAAVREDLGRLQAEIAAKNLRNETYDRMCSLSAVVEEALPHLADTQIARITQRNIAALVSGDSRYVAVTVKSLPRLRADAGKDGAKSQAALQTIADRIEELARQL